MRYEPEFEWDAEKAASNVARHGVLFKDAIGVLYDEFAVTLPDENPNEERFVTVGDGHAGQADRGRVYVAAECRPDHFRSQGNPHRGAALCRRRPMKDEYD